jgi:endonuclease YncB( thermonuclease family)
LLDEGAYLFYAPRNLASRAAYIIRIKHGLAWWYQRYARHETILQDLEREARQGRRGLWADRDPVPPWEWRKMAAAR